MKQPTGLLFAVICTVSLPAFGANEVYAPMKLDDARAHVLTWAASQSGITQEQQRLIHGLNGARNVLLKRPSEIGGVVCRRLLGHLMIVPEIETDPGP